MIGTGTMDAAAQPAVAEASRPGRDALVEVVGLTKHFPLGRGLFGRETAALRAVDGVDFDVRRGETLSLVGESGCGKSTTGRSILQIHRPTSGSVRFDGTELTTLRGGALRRMRRRMQMVFQDPYASLDPRMRVGEVIGEPLDIHGLARGKRRERIAELLELVGLSPDFTDRFPHEFSGGQRQRIGIARALAVEPDFIVLDEPISALDVSIQAQLINLLDRLQRDLDLTYLLIAHDLAVVRHTSDRVAVMYLGKVMELGDSGELFSNPLHPYTIALLSAVPNPDPETEATRKRIILVGDVPSPANPPAGCRFHTRCWLRESLGNPENCATQTPPLQAVTPNHQVACHWVDEVPAARPQRALPVINTVAAPAVGA